MSRKILIFFVNIEFVFYLGRDIVIFFGKFVKLFLKGDGCVVRTEDFGGQSVHESVQIFVQDRRVEPVKEIIRSLLVLHEKLDVLVHPFLHLRRVVVADRILSEEIEFNDEFFA